MKYFVQKKEFDLKERSASLQFFINGIFIKTSQVLFIHSCYFLYKQKFFNVENSVTSCLTFKRHSESGLLILLLLIKKKVYI